MCGRIAIDRAGPASHAGMNQQIEHQRHVFGIIQQQCASACQSQTAGTFKHGRLRHQVEGIALLLLVDRPQVAVPLQTLLATHSSEPPDRVLSSG
jgi:D-alanyl-D-alanine carboxypeptidase